MHRYPNELFQQGIGTILHQCVSSVTREVEYETDYHIHLVSILSILFALQLLPLQHPPSYSRDSMSTVLFMLFH